MKKATEKQTAVTKSMICPGAILRGGYAARYVMSVSEDGKLMYQTHDISSGAPFGIPDQCSIATIQRWADRVPTEQEARVIRPRIGECDQRAVDRFQKLIDGITRSLTDQQLLDECERRGLLVRRPRGRG